MNNITLIGMPGSGKSTTGIVLAKVLGYRFLDSDLIIQEREGKLLWQIIEERGNDALLEIENKVNSELCTEKTVIAPGGSIVHCEDGMKHLRNTSLVIYLRLPLETIKERLGNFDKRGVTMPQGWSLERLYNERTPLYEKAAHIVFDGEGYTVNEAAKRIAQLVAEHLEQNNL